MPTGDEFFLSHYFNNFKEIGKDRYFTENSKIVIHIGNNLNLTIATKNDKSIILDLNDNFFSDLDKELSKGRIYIAKENHKIIGFSYYVRGIILLYYISISMFVDKNDIELKYYTH